VSNKADKKERVFKLPNPQTWAKTALRSKSIIWPGRTEALRRARVNRGLYRCVECQGDFRRHEIQLDHIEPVVSIEHGWQGFDQWIARLFCPPEGFRCLCKNCHESITQIQDEMRKFYKAQRKQNED